MEARLIYSENKEPWLQVTSARIIIQNSEKKPDNTDL